MLLRRPKSLPPQQPTDYPAGTFISTEKGYFYIADSTKRYRMLSKRVLDSWRPHRVVETSEAAVGKYRIAAKMKFRNGSLISNITDGKVYLVVNAKRCPLTSPEAYDRLGIKINSSDIVIVSQDEIKLHELGEEIA